MSLPEPTSEKRKVAIVGWAGTSRDLAPWNDPSWEMWALNTMGQHAQYADKCDRIFQLHSVRALDLDRNEDPAYWGWLCTNEKTPIYMHHPRPEFKRAVQYPTDEILKKFRNYFTNTVSWMIALAIDEQVDTLGVWGVDMAHGSEYAAQRPSCEYFLGLAEAAGIEIVLPAECDLLKTGGQYGLIDDSALYAACQTRINEMTTRVNEAMAAQNQNAMVISKLQGGIEVAQYIQATWALPQPNQIKES